MKKYFLFGAKNYTEVASAAAPEGTKIAHHLTGDLEGLNELPFVFDLVKLTVTKKGLQKDPDTTGLGKLWLDLQPNSLAWPLFSANLKEAIEKELTGQEQLDWISAKVKNKGEVRDYFIPRFNKKLDTLDPEKSTRIKPFFKGSKIENLAIFHKPEEYDLWKITLELYVNENVKKRIEKNHLTGISFDKIAVSG